MLLANGFILAEKKNVAIKLRMEMANQNSLPTVKTAELVELQRLRELLGQKKRIRAGQVTLPFLALSLGQWVKEQNVSLLFILPGSLEAQIFYADLETMHPGVARGMLLERRGHLRMVEGRMRALVALKKASPGIVVATGTGLGIPQPPLYGTDIHVGDSIPSWEDFLLSLQQMQYGPGEEPLDRGEFKVMGDTLLLHLLTGERYRLSFIGNEVEEILEETRGKRRLKEIFLPDLRQGSVEAPCWIPDWLNPSIRVGIFEEEWTLQQYQRIREEMGQGKTWMNPEHLRVFFTNRGSLSFSTFLEEDSDLALGVREITLSLSQEGIFHEFTRKLTQKSIQCIVYTSSPLSPPKEWMEAGIQHYPGEISSGFYCSLSSLLVLSGREIQKHRGYSLPALEGLTLLTQLKEGSPVVHESHGIGLYRGLVRKKMGAEEKDYLCLEYQDGDKLFVPVEQIGQVHPYIGVSGEEPILARLGSRRWAQQKATVKRATARYARELYDLYLHRMTVERLPYHPVPEWEEQLEQSFEYPETPDQIAALLEIRRDLEGVRVMDRLLCGDVGFGKTEVAIRAAFHAVLNGKQVAVLAPTTILAYQHFLTFERRLKDFPLEIALLSRFKTPEEIRHILHRVQEGKTDIVIGTHRLLQPDVRFKNLGLLIIDEEQRFGVEQKERYKFLHQKVDILSLTATPIPRTLYLSLIQMKGISYLRTPPLGRMPVITTVSPYSEERVKKAVHRELDRGGQVFYLYNRVEKIQHRTAEIQEMFPDARVGMGHGKMPAKRLEKVLLDFLRKNTQILVCTTIIENGIDMPGADTLIVEESERFGLADLHQLRGRVGRGDKQAYALFFYSPTRPPGIKARERLTTVGTWTDLGSGLKVALRDLEVRGAGTLLGKRQHGYAAQVGFFLYTRILAGSLSCLMKKPVKEKSPPLLSIPVASYIPEDFIPDVRERLHYYEWMMQAENPEELKRLELQLLATRGEIPLPVRALLDVALIKVLAEALDIQMIRVNPSTGEVVFITSRKDWLPRAIEERWKVKPEGESFELRTLLKNRAHPHSLVAELLQRLKTLHEKILSSIEEPGENSV